MRGPCSKILQLRLIGVELGTAEFTRTVHRHQDDPAAPGRSRGMWCDEEGDEEESIDRRRADNRRGPRTCPIPSSRLLSYLDLFGGGMVWRSKERAHDTKGDRTDDEDRTTELRASRSRRTWSEWLSWRGQAASVVAQDRSPGPALTSYVFVSTFAVLPRGACSRRRAVPDWTSLGPWSREGRSRFTSASPASLHFHAALLPLFLSLALFLLATGWLRSRKPRTEHRGLPVSLPPLLPRPLRDISGPTGRESRQGGERNEERER